MKKTQLFFFLLFGTLTLICTLLMLLVEPKPWYWWCEEEIELGSSEGRDAAAAQPFPPQCFLRSVGWMKCWRKGEIGGGQELIGRTEGRLIG